MLYPKKKIDPKKEYYALTFFASHEGDIFIGGQTEWVGFADKDMKIELRQYTIINAAYFADFWKDFKMPFCVVNNIDDFIKWYVSGGHALITKDVAIDMLPFSLKPSPTVKLGNKGFNCVRILPDSIFKKTPSPKKRMAILKRDNFKCRVCGRRPDDNVDIQLHVHHIRPYAEGGFTHEDNLITLCHTCHSGLDPHYEWSLYSMLDNTSLDTKSRERQKYLQDVENYRNAKKKEL